MVKVYHSHKKSLLIKLSEQFPLAIKIISNKRKAWNGLIFILNYVKKNQEHRYNKVYREHTALLSLLQKEIGNETIYKDKRLREITARTTSHLTHNWYLQEPIFIEVLEVLKKILVPNDVLLIPNLFELDYETIIILSNLTNQKNYPSIIIGYLHTNKEADLDENGIQWEWTIFRREEVVLRFFYCENFEFIDLTDASNRISQNGIHWSMTDIQYNEITSSNDFINKFMELKHAFHLFGFTQVLSDGISLIHFVENSNSIREIANVIGELYALVALASHNRQFTSKGNQVLAEFIEKNLKKALEYELEPGLRAATLYRLAVLYGRRKKNFQESINVCNEMISFLGSTEMTNQEYLYQLGWAYNIRAYNYQLMKNRNKAKADIDKSQEYFEELKQFIENSDDKLKEIWIRDTLKSNTLPLYNKSRTLNDRVELDNQANKIFQYLEENDVADLNEAENRLRYYKSKHNLVRAVKWAKTGISKSIQNHLAFKEQFFRAEYADLLYKHGNIKASNEEIDIIEKNYNRFQHPYTMPNIGLSTIMIRIRGCKFNDAFKILNQHIINSKDTKVLAELYATRYLTSVLAGKELDFHEDKDSSIDLASNIGNASIMLRVISLIGCALREIGDISNLKDAYKNGVEIIDYGIKNGLSLPSEHALHILVGHQELYGLNKDRMLFIDENLASMLYTSESWWVIPRIFDLIGNQYSLSKKTMDIITQRIESLEQTNRIIKYS